MSAHSLPVPTTHFEKATFIVVVYGRLKIARSLLVLDLG